MSCFIRTAMSAPNPSRMIIHEDRIQSDPQTCLTICLSFRLLFSQDRHFFCLAQFSFCFNSQFMAFYLLRFASSCYLFFLFILLLLYFSVFFLNLLHFCYATSKESLITFSYSAIPLQCLLGKHVGRK